MLGSTQRLKLMASSPALRVAGSVLIREMGPERAGDEPVLAQQGNRIKSGTGLLLVGRGAVRIPPTSAERVGLPAGGFLGLGPVF